MDREEAAVLYERKLRELCNDDEWAVFHRRLHPDQYPPRPWWRRLLRLT